MSNNLPPLKRDDSVNVETGSIFQNTTIDPHGYDAGRSPKEYKKMAQSSQNYQNKSTSLAYADRVQRNNNYFKMNEPENAKNESFEDPESLKLVPVGYFGKPAGGLESPSQANTTSRYNDNRVMNSVEFPQLNKTNYTETMYSLKSQSSVSPHDRIMQTLERKKRKKNTKSMAENEFNVKSQELTVYKEPHNTQPGYGQQRSHKRNKDKNQKQFYEITTIEEDEESQGSTNYHNLGLSKKKNQMVRYDPNVDLQGHVSPSKPSKGGYASMMKPRGLSVRQHKTSENIDAAPSANHFNKHKGSISKDHHTISAHIDDSRQRSVQ